MGNNGHEISPRLGIVKPLQADGPAVVEAWVISAVHRVTYPTLHVRPCRGGSRTAPTRSADTTPLPQKSPVVGGLFHVAAYIDGRALVDAGANCLGPARSSRPGHIRQGLHLMGKNGFHGPAFNAWEPFKELVHCASQFYGTAVRLASEKPVLPKQDRLLSVVIEGVVYVVRIRCTTPSASRPVSRWLPKPL